VANISPAASTKQILSLANRRQIVARRQLDAHLVADTHPNVSIEHRPLIRRSSTRPESKAHVLDYGPADLAPIPA